LKSLIVVLLVALSMVGCASNRAGQAVSYQELSSKQYTNKDCSNIEYHVRFLETQLQARGLTNAVPEQLNENDRVYNSTVRIMIWNLRIGCNNPNRYSKK
jgi:uncharacterized protein YcfL